MMVKNFLKRCNACVNATEKYWGVWAARIIGRYIKNIRLPLGDQYGTALLIYTTLPFKLKGVNCHSNIQEAIAMVDVLANLGFAVDVMDYHNRFYIDTACYDLIIGFGDPFERNFYIKNTAIKIHYATGAPQSIHCFAEVDRFKNIYKRNACELFPNRILDRSWPCSEILSDAIITVTDGWAKEQYEKRHNNVYSVPITSLSKVSDVDVAIDKKLSNHFVWFGGFGAVHKGLDLCLDVITARDDFILHVCGNVENESDFFHFYEKVISQPNVQYHGFVDANSDAMHAIMTVASFVILPSCSEGCATSVLTCMAWGCIPVVTEQCGITFKGAVSIENGSVDAVNRAIDFCLKLNSSHRKEIMLNSVEWVNSTHSLANYKSTLASVISEIIAQTNTVNRLAY